MTEQEQEKLKACKVHRCDARATSNGMCKLHDARVRRTGSPQLRTLRDRLIEGVKADDESGCWNWLRVTTDFGHGRIRVNGRKMIASRAAWLAWNGAIPDGMQVCHHCDNPRCINPAHLFLGTNTDNVRDCIAKGRFRAGLNFKGKPAWNRKK